MSSTHNTPDVNNAARLKKYSAVSFFERAFRFFGIRKVTPFSAEKANQLIIKSTTSPSASRPLSDHTITVDSTEDASNTQNQDDITHICLLQTYTGFRANSKNLLSLQNYLTQKHGQLKSEETVKSFHTRIQIAMILSGLAKYNKTVGVTALHKHRANNAITSKQLTQLNHYLNIPTKNLLLSFAEHRPDYHHNTSLLTQVMSTSEFYKHLATVPTDDEPSTVESALARQTLMRIYFTQGDGAQLLRTCNYQQVDVLDKLLPNTPSSSQISIEELESLHQLQRAAKQKSAPTFSSIIEQQSKNSNFYFEKGSEEIIFSPDNNIHCFLLFLSDFRRFYLAYNNAIKIKISQQMAEENTDDPELYEENDKRSAAMSTVDSLAHILSHTIMINKLPALFGPREHKPSSYKQTVLKNSSDVIYWNSDDVQPRPKMRHMEIIEETTKC